MSVKVRIKQNSIFKKKSNIKSIIKLTNLSYGICDENYRLISNTTADHTLLYDKNKLARGIDVSLEKTDIVLFLNLPTTSFEIREFYEIIEKLCNELKITTYIRDEENVSLNDNDKFIKCDEQESISALKQIQEDIEQGKYERLEIFGIYNPISLGLKEVKQIDNNLDNFEEYLHNIQSINVYYAAPRVYKVKDKLIGIYAVGPNIPTVVPTTPYIVLNQLEGINDWYVLLSENKTIKYEDFINNINSKQYYDANHVIALYNDNDINDLLSKYFTEI